MIELKPCPFCGAKPTIRRIGDCYAVKCGGCGARGPKAIIQDWHSTKYVAQGQAAAKWNRREGATHDK